MSKQTDDDEVAEQIARDVGLISEARLSNKQRAALKRLLVAATRGL